jgi:hypothetical protein
MATDGFDREKGDRQGGRDETQSVLLKWRIVLGRRLSNRRKIISEFFSQSSVSFFTIFTLLLFLIVRVATMMIHKLPICLCILSGFIFQSQAIAEGSDKKESSKKILQTIQRQASLQAFSEAEIFLEQNATDQDTEVVLLAKGGDVGLRRLWIFSPTRQLIYRFVSPGTGNNIGGREIVIESPEPVNLEVILKAYPEGVYTFVGKDYNDQWLYSQTTLVHDIPLPVTITFPAEESEVPRFDFEVVWESAIPADHYLVELQNEVSEEELLVEVPGDQNSFRAPEEWLVSGVEYQVSVGVVNDNGNITFVEQSAMTSE